MNSCYENSNHQSRDLTSASRIFLLVVTVLVLIVFAGCGVDHQVVGNKYLNKTFGVSLQTPSSGQWFMVTEGDVLKINNRTYPKLKMSFSVVENPGTRDSGTFISDYLRNEYKKFTTPSKARKHNMQFRGIKATMVEFNGSFDYTPQQYVLVGIVKDARGFVFSVSCPITEYPKIKNEVQAVIGSINISKPEIKK
ncbi:MAG: hypothetical protein CVV64_05695 [Candidatus Wallbacteria bacterium HGW-Wallbacteria-1]|jgi:hypothetical protein|uniref:Uncharacterized protein n=1 Tax=Candidatus Wallbacteria bacterium HGW-Wallbacteria-1 TaxID=2013854 RepID=A0A2N1PSE5_9BACT|nr:MAG: hypothetical protein CVV64_05695 [Candidatus Wallbacteria bacterium HGW-Wallbacteria-1]